MDAAVADIFGFHALQLGLPEQDFLRTNRIPLRQTLGKGPGVQLRCDFTQLPIASQSVDLVILPHVLEFHPEPHQILREVERILMPEGQLFILGFNPISLWGLRRCLPEEQKDFPWNGHYLSVLRLRDWLKLLNFELDRGAFGAYAPPCRSEKWLRRWQFMELAGDRWWGFAGSVYMLRAIKRIHGMRLIIPNWRNRKLEAKALTTIARKEHKDG